MLAFDPRRRSEDMTPIVRDVDVTRYAMAVLKEYMPERLERPGHIDAYKFIEQYLGANVEIMNIYTDSRDDFIAGAAVFNPQHVKVFDRDNMTTKKILVPANTVIIDEQVTGRFKKGFERFTVLHEAGHLMMHKEVYQVRHEGGRTAGNSALCMRSNIGSSGKLVTSLDFREHQANKEAIKESEKVIGYLEGVHKHYGEIFRERLSGTFSIREMERNLGISEANVRRWNKEVTRLAMKYYFKHYF